MSRWEYLEVRVSGPEWGSSDGRCGRMTNMRLRCLSWHSAAPLMNELGEQGWELAGVADDESLNSFMMFFKRPKAEKVPFPQIDGSERSRDPVEVG